MVWYCYRHKQHSIDDACWKCDDEHDQPYIDAWLAGWDARHDLYSNESTEENKEKQLREWKDKNKRLLRRKVRGIHDT